MSSAFGGVILGDSGSGSDCGAVWRSRRSSWVIASVVIGGAVWGDARRNFSTMQRTLRDADGVLFFDVQRPGVGPFRGVSSEALQHGSNPQPIGERAPV